jgi:hypothetical protein
MARTRGPQIVKTTGERERFDERKLRSSLRRAGAGRADIARVVAEVREALRDGMTTREVYHIAFRALRRAPKPTAARYSLQRAIGELGPSGFPFEQFVGLLWKTEGYRVRVGARLKGRYVRHEIDVIGRRNGARDFAECKFTSLPHGKIDVKVALYLYARAVDLRGVAGGYRDFWLITNGRFTQDAIAFGEGMGLRLLAWDHPAGDGLKERIDRAGLHPVTALTDLRRRDKQVLLGDGIVLCQQIVERPASLGGLGLGEDRRARVVAEARALCDLGP